MSKSAMNQIEAEISELRYTIHHRETYIAKREQAGDPAALAIRRGLGRLRDVERRLVKIQADMRAAHEAEDLQRSYAE